jgi:hypothetical protein
MTFNKHLHSSIKNKFGVTALDIIPSGDDELRSLVRKSQAQASVSADDVASGKLFIHTSQQHRLINVRR